jgi:hypothetical protein
MSVQSKKMENWKQTRSACITAIMDSDGEITLEAFSKQYPKSKQTIVTHLTNLDTSWQKLKDVNYHPVESPKTPVQNSPKVQVPEILPEIEEGDLKSLLWEKMKNSSGNDLVRLTELYNQCLAKEESAIQTYAKWVQDNLDTLFTLTNKLQFNINCLDEYNEMTDWSFTKLAEDIKKHFPIFNFEKREVDNHRGKDEDYTEEKLETIEHWLDEGNKYDDFKEIIQDWEISKKQIDEFKNQKPIREFDKKLKSKLREDLKAKYGEEYHKQDEFWDMMEGIRKQVEQKYQEWESKNSSI